MSAGKMKKDELTAEIQRLQERNSFLETQLLNKQNQSPLPKLSFTDEGKFWLDEAQRIGRLGLYSFDYQKNSWESSAALNEIFGISESYAKTFESWLQIITPDFREEMRQYFLNLISTKGHFEKAYKIKKISSGEELWVFGRGELTFDRNDALLGMFGTIQDINDLQRSDEEIKQWKQRYDIITAASGQVVYDLDYSTREVAWGGTIDHLLGYTSRELNGRLSQWERLIHPDDVNETVRVRSYAESHALSLEMQYRIRHKDGHYLDILDRGIPMTTPDGKAARMIGIMEDITERKRFEEEMKIKDRAIESSINAIAMTDLNGIITYVNPAFIEMWGYKDYYDVLGKPVNNFWLEPDSSIDIITALKIHGVWVGELAGIRKDGNLFYLEISASMVSDDKSIPLYMFGAFVDITERRLAELALKEKTDEMELFFTTALDLFCIADTDGYFRVLNNEWENTLGYPIADLINKPFLDLVHPDDVNATVEAITQLAQNKTIINFINRYRRRDGSYCWIEWRTKPHGKMIFAAARDISSRKVFERQLQQYSDIVSRMQVGLYVYRLDDIRDDRSLRMVSINPASIAFFNRPQEMIIGKKIDELFPELRKDDMPARFADVVRTGVSFEVSEFHYHFTMAESAWFSFKCFPLPDSCVCVLFEDISSRKKAEIALKESEVRMRFALDGANDGIWDVNLITNDLYLSPRDCELLGYAPEEHEKIAAIWNDLVHPDDMPETVARLNAHLEGKDELFQVQQRLHMKSGNWKWILTRGKISLRDTGGKPVRITGTHTDITERMLYEDKIKATLVEKEALLRELYHRTKNNMQVICALMSMQSSYVKEPKVSEVFKDMENRIQSMSLVHQKLYQSKNLSSIQFNEYIGDLAHLLVQSYNVSENKVALSLDLIEFSVMIDTAVPCGLILNELISNSLKHAFPGDARGEISIRVRRTNEGLIEMRVADNGVGVKPGFDFRESGRMGIRSVYAIGEQQLQGSVEFESSNGTQCTFVFSDNSNEAVI